MKETGKDAALQRAMTGLLKDCMDERFKETPDYKTIIAKAVSLGMKYQYEKIKTGIDIVFSELK